VLVAVLTPEEAMALGRRAAERSPETRELLLRGGYLLSRLLRDTEQPPMHAFDAEGRVIGYLGGHVVHLDPETGATGCTCGADAGCDHTTALVLLHGWACDQGLADPPSPRGTERPTGTRPSTPRPDQRGGAAWTAEEVARILAHGEDWADGLTPGLLCVGGPDATTAELRSRWRMVARQAGRPLDARTAAAIDLLSRQPTVEIAYGMAPTRLAVAVGGEHAVFLPSPRRLGRHEWGCTCSQARPGHPCTHAVAAELISRAAAADAFTVRTLPSTPDDTIPPAALVA